MAEWFEEWFDSPYYHILYSHRDHNEAEHFIDKLMIYVNLDSGSHILDVACGSGRHALYLSKHGYATTGIDLSENSIATAKKNTSDMLQFSVEDMRDFRLKQSYNLITNLFTSFGYFKDTNDNLRTLESIKLHLKENGTFVLDFMNTAKTVKNLVLESKAEKQDIIFNIARQVKDGQILKTIEFIDNEGIERSYTERVQALYYEDFLDFFKSSDLELINCYGDYTLTDEYHQDSDRMIFILKHKQ